MTAVTVTATVGTTCHYWFTPQTSWTDGPNVLDIVNGWSAETSDQTPSDLTFTLDDSALWNIRMDFRGAEPIVFDGLDVSGGGDLFTLLAAQDWAP